MPETNGISMQIDSIIMKRKEKAEKMRRRKADMQELRKTLNGCSQLVGRTNTIEDPALREQCRELFSKLAIPNEVTKQINAITRRMDEAVTRFERDSLNVATVGRARQGKSTFLQAVGNLKDDIIPAYDAGDCTGAVSVIKNDPSIQIGQVRVDLTFRSKEELLDIVRGYINNIDPAYLSSYPVDYDTIADVNIGALEASIEAGDSARTIQLEHLRRIVDDFNENSDSRSLPIKSLCGEAGRSLTDPNEIRKYVAQNNGKSIDDPDRENYYSYLAVKQATINCRFSDDVGKLVLVDTIGLGDTQFGIEGSMLDTVDKQCDAAIVVTKPDSGIKDQDQKLYDLLRGRFAKRDTSKWLFYLANEQPGYNSNAVDTFVRHVKEKNFAVAGCLKINCKNQESVRGDFLIPMLQTLVSNIEEIDTAYIGEIDAMCAELQRMLMKLIESFPEPGTMEVNKLINQEVNRLGKECYARMASNLAKQVNIWYEKRSKPNDTMWNRVKDILDDLESILPSAEELQRVIEDSGTIMGAALWETPLNYVRNEVTDQFILINGLMEKETLEFKNSVVHELYESLKKLSNRERNKTDAEAEDEDEDEPDQAAWLWEVIEPLLRDKPEYNQIYRALQFISEFEFNVRAQLIQEVRNQLRIINPMTPEYYMQPNYVFSRANVGQAVHFYLTSRLAILEDGLRHSLSAMNKMPNQAFYAAAEEFYDRLTFASDFKNDKFVDMSEIWGQFFIEYSSILWAEEVERRKAADVVMNEYKEYRRMLEDKLKLIA